MSPDLFRNKRILFVALAGPVLLLSFSTPALAQRNDTQNTTAAQQTPIPAQQNTPALAAKPNTTGLQQKEQENKTSQPGSYSTSTLVVVVILFVVLGSLFFVQFFWSQQLERTGFLGSLFRDSMKDIEYKRLASGYIDDFTNGRYHDDVSHDPEWLKENSPPKGYFQGNRRPGTSLPGFGDWGETPGVNNLPGAGPVPVERTIEIEAPRAKQREYQTSVEEWRQKVDAEARQRYKRDLELARSRADDLSRKAVSVDFSVLQGKGPEFVLGFTTIVAIAFAVLALGILGVLKSEQIGTLLAAIAGYVLGRATARGAATTEAAQSTPPPAEPKPKVIGKAA